MPHFDAIPFQTSPRASEIVAELSVRLQRLKQTNAFSASSFSTVVSQLWQTQSIRRSWRNVTFEYHNGFFAAFEGIVCFCHTLLFGLPTGGVYPITSVVPARKLVDHSGQKSYVTVGSSGKPIDFVEVRLGPPFWETSPGNLPADRIANLCATVVGANAIIFDHLVDQAAKSDWPNLLACLLGDAAQRLPDRLAAQRGTTAGVSDDQHPLYWAEVQAVMRQRWLSQQFARREEVEWTEQTFIEYWVPRLREHLLYHEVGGHRADMLILQTDTTPPQIAGLSEARACLTEMAFSESPLLGLVTLATFFGGASATHLQYATWACSELVSRVQKRRTSGKVGDLLMCPIDDVVTLRNAAIEVLAQSEPMLGELRRNSGGGLVT